MELVYPSSAKPILWVSIHSYGHRSLYPMMLDTGADATCFPAAYAALIGHDNHAIGVKTGHSLGVGGPSNSFSHSLSVSLIDPRTNSTKSNDPLDSMPIAWTSKLSEFVFLEKLTLQFGLLGRDIMREWKSVELSPKKAKWIIRITI